MEEKKEIKFNIQSIIVSKFNFEFKEELIKILNETQQLPDNYTFEINCRNLGYVQNNTMNIFVNVKVFLDKEKKIELGFIQVENIYHVDNLRDFYDEKNNILNLPQQFEATLISISLSHTRAVMFTRLAGTILQNALLPIMNPQDFLRKTEGKEKEKIRAES